jgi:hypothetical protein
MIGNHWFKAIAIADDVSYLDAATDHFEKELLEAGAECEIKGSLEQAAARLPGIFQYRYHQLQEVEAILEYLNIELKKLRSIHFRKYKETYNTDLASTVIEKYIDGEDDIVAWTKAVNAFALIRNQFAGITKSLDIKNFQIGHATKLRVMGIEDAFLD